MTSEKNFDILIVGGGPIGSYAAWKIAEQGLSVLVLERKAKDAPASDIGAFHFEHVAFERAGLPCPEKSEAICIYEGMVIHAPDPSLSVQVKGVQTWALELDPFIADLRKRAENSGAAFEYGIKATGPIMDGGRVLGVKAEREGTEVEFRATVTIDATGVARTLRRKIPSMNFPGDDYAMSVYMEYWRDAEIKPDDGLHSHLGCSGWTCRYPDYWIVGIGQTDSPSNTLKAHAKFSDRLYPGKREIVDRVTGRIPYAPAPPTFVEDGLLLLGDAAATNKPFSGEGIASGMALALIASEELPGAVRNGGSKKDLWEINRRYFTTQGAKFGFIHTMGISLLNMTEEELNSAFKIGLIQGEDLRQTFIDYEVKKPVMQWAGPVLRLLTRGRMARKYIVAAARAAKVAKAMEKFPTVQGHEAWTRKYLRMLPDLTSSPR
jgi:flavin-dependent dehydrogenase